MGWWRDVCRVGRTVARAGEVGGLGGFGKLAQPPIEGWYGDVTAVG